MIISQERWDKTFKNFEVYDCTYGFEHGRVGLLLIEKIDENHIEYGNDYYMPKHKLVSIVIDNPPENRVFGMSFGNLSYPTISAGWSPSQTELVIVDIDCEVISYKTREYKGRENNLDIPISKSSDMRTAIIKVVRVGTSVYAIGGGLRIYKRINHQVWLDALVPGDQIYRVYAGLREEYCIDGRRTINTQDIRLCRRTLRDAATRGRSPAKTLAMWDRVLDGETRYIKGFKTTADFLLDTSFTYELGLIAKLLQKVRQQFTLEGHNAELWDETARRFEHVAPVALDLLPADSMLREFYAGEIGGKTAQ